MANFLAFPRGSVIDDFNRAAAGPPPSANWTDKVLSSDNANLVVSGSVLASSGAGGTVGGAYWSAGTFGPDVDVWLTALTTVVGANHSLFARLDSPATVGVDGYRVAANIATSGGAGTASFSIQKIFDDGASPLQSLTIGTGFEIPFDFGMRITGGTQQVFFKPTGSTWQPVAVRTVNGTITAAGFVGVRYSGTITGDNFGAATWPYGTTMEFVNSVVPSVTGVPNVGNVLTADPGTWSPTPTSYGYRWERADNASDLNLVTVGSTGSTYTVAAADETKFIRCTVIPKVV